MKIHIFKETFRRLFLIGITVSLIVIFKHLEPLIFCNNMVYLLCIYSILIWIWIFIYVYTYLQTLLKKMPRIFCLNFAYAQFVYILRVTIQMENYVCIQVRKVVFFSMLIGQHLSLAAGFTFCALQWAEKHKRLSQKR